ncbi:MAG: sugar phosphate isomerase/epimerase [Acidobacteriaceae bacterium]
MKQSRRDFVKAGSAALFCSSMVGRSQAQTLHVPLGLQLYSVRQQIPSNYAGTLKQIGALGYREVESAGYFNQTPAEVKQAMRQAGLRLVSAHYSSDDLNHKLDDILAFSKEVGNSYIICSYPGFKDPARVQSIPAKERSNAFNLEDWRWNAEQFNAFGAKVSAAGLKFGYHNHTMEFRKMDGVVPYDELLRLTDPAHVTMEMDCGWVVVGGGNPVEYLRKYPTRITMLHVKDFKNIAPTSSVVNVPTIVELGQGSIDYRPIFAQAAKSGLVKHAFVEQEGYTVAPIEGLKIDAEYMRKLGIG